MRHAPHVKQRQKNMAALSLAVLRKKWGIWSWVALAARNGALLNLRVRAKKVFAEAALKS